MSIEYSESLKSRIFWVIKNNPGIVRTEVRDMLKLQNNISGPAIKELIDAKMIVEGKTRLSKTTNKPGKTLYVSIDWATEIDAQNRIFE